MSNWDGALRLGGAAAQTVRRVIRQVRRRRICIETVSPPFSVFAGVVRALRQEVAMAEGREASRARAPGSPLPGEDRDVRMAGRDGE